VRARPVIGVLLILLTAALAATVPPSAVALTELDAARERRAAIEDRFDTTLGDLEGLEDSIHAAEQELASLEEEDERLRAELDDLRAQMSARTRLAFMRGNPSSVQLLVTGRNPSEVAERAVMLESLALRDRAAAEQAETLRIGLEQNRALREGRIEQLEQMRDDLADRVAQLQADLEQAQADERFFELKARRQREVSTSFMSGIYSCPVGDPVFFRDTWGAPRSGGRSHKGVDMMAPHGTPVYAITGGRITRMNNSGLGGISLYMFGDDGNEYYYTHLQGYAADSYVGARVDAGDLVAYNGSTGNADASAPHVHFQVHPGGGSPVNPYPYAAAACGR
jgi:murein DD-endopeptidase MepM/ murein hydrolase activator NlpD